jgi:AmmeMemoRadiSam system protein A
MSEDSNRSVGEPAQTLSREEKQALLHVARQALCEYLGEGKVYDFKTDSRALLQPGAVFVTLRQRESGDLRGCRGEYMASRPLVDSVIHMSIASATDDPRFPPVTIGEVADLAIDISALTPLRPIRPDEVVVGRHGIRIVKGGRSGLLLPQVPARYGWDSEQFLNWVCRKAGLPDNAWRSEGIELYGFESEGWGELDEAGD